MYDHTFFGFCDFSDKFETVIQEMMVFIILKVINVTKSKTIAVEIIMVIRRRIIIHILYMAEDSIMVPHYIRNIETNISSYVPVEKYHKLSLCCCYTQ